MVTFEVSEGAKLPTRVHPDDAGIDLYSHVGVAIPAGGRVAVSTGVKVALPPGTTGLIWPKSGLARRFGIDVLGGCIDAGYRGELIVILVNHGDSEVLFDAGSPVAQLLIIPILTPMPVSGLVSVDTARGAKGFGSSYLDGASA